MKTKHKLLSKAAAVFVTICMLFTLTPLSAFAFNPDWYKTQIKSVSIGAPITDLNGKKYLPVTVNFTAEEDISDENAVYFLEGYLKATLKDGTTAEGINGLGMTLIGPLKPDALDGMGSNAYSWVWTPGEGSEMGSGEGVLKYNIPLLEDGETQAVEKSPYTGQQEVNGLKEGDKVSFQIETVMNTDTIPADILPESGSLFSDEFKVMIEDSSNYPKTITTSEGECKHDGELTYYAANAKQHTIFCEKCEEEIGCENHSFTRHLTGYFSTDKFFYHGENKTPDDFNDVYGEADVCAKCNAATNFVAAKDLTKATPAVEEGKAYTQDEAKNIPLKDEEGETVSKDSYTVSVETSKTDENKWTVTYEPIEGKSTGKKSIEVKKACEHDGELTYYAANAKQHTIFCEKCEEEIGCENHSFTRHLTGYFSTDKFFYHGENKTPDDFNDVYGEADVCAKCNAATNFVAAKDLTKATPAVEEGKAYTQDEAKKITLKDEDGKTVDKDSYTVSVEQSKTDENKWVVVFEPISGKSIGEVSVEVPKACQHDGELTYYAANAKQHTIFCEECQKEIGVEDHDFSIHKSGSMDSKTGVFYPIDSEDYHQGDVYGEADICSKCGEVTNFKSAAVKPDLSGAKALIEDLKKYTADEAKLIELELNGEKLDKDTYIVSVEKGENGTLIVTFEPVDEKSTGKKQIEVQCSHENTLWADHGDTCEEYCGDCGAFLSSSSHYFVWQSGVRLCAQCGKIGSINLDTAIVENLEKGKSYTVDEAKQLELSLDGEKLSKETYTVKVESGDAGTLIVTFEPVDGKSTGEKKIEVQCSHENTIWGEKDGRCEEHCVDCHEVLNSTSHYFVWQDGVKICARCGEVDSINLDIYSIIEGAGQTVNKTQESAEFRADGNYESFTGNVEVDGKQLMRGKDFTDKSGSTIITLTFDYLQTLTAGKHTIMVYFEDGYAETEFTVEDTSSHVADDEELEKWAAKDYKDKTGTTANAEITAKGDNQYEITLTDDSGEVVNTYTINPNTGIGTDTDGKAVNLPQTGMSDNRWVFISLAALMCIMGFGLVRKSRKEDEE